ncbi:hypothetical protein GJAV_G00086620 [Gymnothorax javanicus]|nr:hypothetical protein GJAV_G00086620 [Gymnothorax javanicus]
MSDSSALSTCAFTVDVQQRELFFSLGYAQCVWLPSWSSPPSSRLHPLPGLQQQDPEQTQK